MTWINTYSGKRFDFIELVGRDIAEIDSADIIHSLSLQCRFAGHCLRHYSVAEHTMLVMTLCHDQCGWGWDHDGMRLAALHDAHEAYMTDLPRPMKKLPRMEAFSAYEKRVAAHVLRHFGVSLPSSDHIQLVRQMDDLALAIEKRDLMTVNEPWDWLPDPIDRWEEPLDVPGIFRHDRVKLENREEYAPSPLQVRRHLVDMWNRSLL